jgi:hypothetical protein
MTIGAGGADPTVNGVRKGRTSPALTTSEYEPGGGTARLNDPFAEVAVSATALSVAVSRITRAPLMGAPAESTTDPSREAARVAAASARQRTKVRAGSEENPGTGIIEYSWSMYFCGYN